MSKAILDQILKQNNFGVGTPTKSQGVPQNDGGYAVTEESVYSQPELSSRVPSKVKIDNGISTFTLPSGQEFRLDAYGEPVVTPREELKESTKKDVRGGSFADTSKEVDHMVPLALGGTNSPSNLQALVSKKTVSQKVFDLFSGKESEIGDYKPANRQEGKMLVEWEAIKKYKAGEITVFAAMAAVQNYDNEKLVASFLKKDYEPKGVLEQANDKSRETRESLGEFFQNYAKKQAVKETLKTLQGDSRFRDSEDGVAMIRQLSELQDQFHYTLQSKDPAGRVDEAMFSGAVKIFKTAVPFLPKDNTILTGEEVAALTTAPIRMGLAEPIKFVINLGLEKAGSDMKVSLGSYGQQLIWGKGDFERISKVKDGWYGEMYRLTEKKMEEAGLSTDASQNVAFSAVGLIGAVMENPFNLFGKAKLGREAITTALSKLLEQEVGGELSEQALKIVKQGAERISIQPVEQLEFKQSILKETVERVKALGGIAKAPPKKGTEEGGFLLSLQEDIEKEMASKMAKRKAVDAQLETSKGSSRRLATRLVTEADKAEKVAAKTNITIRALEDTAQKTLKATELKGLKAQVKGDLKVAKVEARAGSIIRSQAESILALGKKSEEIRTVKNAAIQALKDKAIDLKARKKLFIEFTKNAVSDKSKSGIYAKLAKATTDGEFAKLSSDFIKAKQKELFDDAVSEVKALAKETEMLKSSEKRQQILSVIDDLDLQKLSKGKQEALVKLQDFLKTEPEAVLRFGNKNWKSVDAFERLDKIPISEKGLRQVLDIVDEMSKMMDEAKLMDEIGVGLDSRLAVGKRKLKLQELRKSSRNLDLDSPTPRNITEKGITTDQLSIEAAKESLREGFDGFATPDVMMALFDKEVERGANYRLIKAPIDNSFGEYQNTAQKIKNQFFDEVKRIETEMSVGGFTKFEDWEMENVTIWAHLQMRGGRQKLLNSVKGTRAERKITQRYLDRFELEGLSKREQAFYDIGRKVFSYFEPQIDNVLRSTTGESLGVVDNYWRSLTDFNERKELGLDISQDYINQSKKTPQGFTKEKKFAGKQVLNFNAMEVVSKHIDDAAYYIHMEETLRDTWKLVSDEEYSKAVGTRGQRWMKEWVDSLLHKSKPKAPPSGLITIVNNIGHAVLGFKLSPVIKQPLAKVTSAGLLGWKDAFAHSDEFLLENSVIRKNIHLASSQQFNRTLDDPAFTELSKNRKLLEWQKKGYWAMRTVDAQTADSVWYEAYIKYHKANGIEWDKKAFQNGEINKDGAEWADLIVRRTQGSGQAKDNPLVFMRQNSELVRAFLQFQRFILNQSFLWRDAKIALKDQDYAKAANLATALVGVGVAESYITSGLAQKLGTKDFADAEKEKTIGDRVLNAVLGQLPGVSNLSSISEFGGSGIVALDTLTKGAEGVKSVIEAKDPLVKIKGGLATVSATAAFTGLSGASQGEQVIKKVIDVIQTKDEVLIEKTSEDLVDLYNASKTTEASDKYRAFVIEHPDLKTKMKKEIDDLMSGITPKEKEMRDGLNNEEQAKEVFKQLNRLKTNEEKKALWLDYRKKKIITDDVSKRVKALLAE